MDNKSEMPYMPVIMIIGKYRGKTDADVETNIRRAEDAAKQLWARGLQ
jgi:hypothetical protein